MYPNVDAPVFSHHAGKYANPFNLGINATSGTVYYTTDGSDPRVEIAGTVSPKATLYGSAVRIADSLTVQARVLSGSTLFDGEIASGENKFVWNAGNQANGMYICKVQYQGQIYHLKIVKK
jgi:hypothetical protein